MTPVPVAPADNGRILEGLAQAQAAVQRLTAWGVRVVSASAAPGRQPPVLVLDTASAWRLPVPGAVYARGTDGFGRYRRHQVNVGGVRCIWTDRPDAAPAPAPAEAPAPGPQLRVIAGGRAGSPAATATGTATPHRGARP